MRDMLPDSLDDRMAPAHTPESSRQERQGGGVGWCLIPPAVVARRDLSVIEKFLLGRVLGLMTSHGYCFASNAWLGDQLGAAKGTIANLLSKLAKQQLIRVDVLRGPDGAVQERRIYPGLALLGGEGGYSFSNEHLLPIRGIPLHQPVTTPLHRLVKEKERTKEKENKEEGRDMRDKEQGREGDSALAPTQDTVDRSGKGEPASTAVSGQEVSSILPPYLPRNFPVDHPVCRVLSCFADRWAAMSGQVLDVSIARAIKEIQQRLKTTPLDDLLQVVDLWFDPGLSWVSLAERGVFHTFIQPRAVSELKGIKAGLSTVPAGRRERAGYIKPLTHDEWANTPSGQVDFSQGRVVYHGHAPEGPAVEDRVSPDGLEVKTWH